MSVLLEQQFSVSPRKVLNEKLEINDGVLGAVPDTLAGVDLRTVREVLLPAEVLPICGREDPTAAVVVIDAAYTNPSLNRYRCLYWPNLRPYAQATSSGMMLSANFQKGDFDVNVSFCVGQGERQ